MRKTIVTIVVLCIFVLIGLNTNPSLAVEYQYGFSLDSPVSHFIVKPDFKNIGTEFVLTNARDPVYMQIQFAKQQDFLVTVYDMDLDEIHAIDQQNDTFLLVPRTSRRFRVEVSNLGNKLELKDYTIDLGMTFKLVQVPKNIQKPVVIEPKIHKYIILGVTEDGKIPLDPKIALFQNIKGSIALLGGPQNIVATVQNRGNYMFSVQGEVIIKGPNNFEEKQVIPVTYIFSNSQKSLSAQGEESLSLISITPDKLTSGQYMASINLTIPGTNTPHLYSRTTFWLISPFYVVASVVICLIMIIILFIVGLRHT